jgi:hypothetical protein
MPKRAADQKTGDVQAVRARAAERMRRSRRRRGKGMRCYTLELRDSEIAALVRRGFLTEGEESDRRAVINAMYAFLDDVLRRPM